MTQQGPGPWGTWDLPCSPYHQSLGQSLDGFRFKFVTPDFGVETVNNRHWSPVCELKTPGVKGVDSVLLLSPVHTFHG